ncbi:peptidylprolyl isomerase [Loktanella agnita]|uniref:peptidylprolyl isomerase n=1 Tax=Loktanella agnita TaxID=287097 RepID=UPI00398591B2
MRAISRLAVFTAWALTLSLGSAAFGQGQLTPAITVNDRVITRYELDQRKRLLQVFRTPGDLDEQARDGLIEDRLKQQELDRVGLQLSEDDVQTAMSEFASRADMSLTQFTRVLGQSGVDQTALRDFVKVGTGWREYIRARFNRQVTITDADVERAKNAQGTSTSEVEVLLSEIIIAAPPQQAARAAAVADQISRIRSLSEFEAAARQVSALPSRDNGGRLGWLPLSNYPPQIGQILLGLRPGQVTEPINIPNGIALFQMRAVREATRRAPPAAQIEYAAYYIPGGRSEDALRTAAEVRDQVDTCNDLYGVAQNQPAEVLDRNTLAPAAIPDDVALELARLDAGEVSYNLTRNDGQTLVFLMLCNRSSTAQAGQSDDAVRNQIRSQRLAGLADALLEDLRASAVIIAR